MFFFIYFNNIIFINTLYNKTGQKMQEARKENQKITITGTPQELAVLEKLKARGTLTIEENEIKKHIDPRFVQACRMKAHYSAKKHEKTTKCINNYINFVNHYNDLCNMLQNMKIDVKRKEFNVVFTELDAGLTENKLNALLVGRLIN